MKVSELSFLQKGSNGYKWAAVIAPDGVVWSVGTFIGDVPEGKTKFWVYPKLKLGRKHIEPLSNLLELACWLSDKEPGP